MNYQSEEDRKARRKIITIAISTVVLILILIVAIVVVSVKQSSPKSSEQVTTFEVVESDEPEANKSEEKKANTQFSQITTKTTTPVVTETASSVPTTGPEDFLPIALILGALTAFITSTHLAKKSA